MGDFPAENGGHLPSILNTYCHFGQTKIIFDVLKVSVYESYFSKLSKHYF